MRIVGFVVGLLSFLVAFISAFLSAAPFTPAVYTVVLTAPLGVVAIVTGSKRVGWLAVYWSACVFLASWTLQNSSQVGDWSLLFAYVFGCILSTVQLARYVFLCWQGIDRD